MSASSSRMRIRINQRLERITVCNVVRIQKSFLYANVDQSVLWQKVFHIIRNDGVEVNHILQTPYAKIITSSGQFS